MSLLIEALNKIEAHKTRHQIAAQYSPSHQSHSRWLRVGLIAIIFIGMALFAIIKSDYLLSIYNLMHHKMNDNNNNRSSRINNLKYNESKQAEYKLGKTDSVNTTDDDYTQPSSKMQTNQEAYKTKASRLMKSNETQISNRMSGEHNHAKKTASLQNNANDFQGATTDDNERQPVINKSYQSPVEDGWHALQSGKLDTAAEIFRSAYKENRNDINVLLGLAAVSMQSKQTADAANYYERILELNPYHPDAIAGLALIRAPADPLGWESRLVVALQQNPNHAMLWSALGIAKFHRSLWREADYAFAQAANLEPNKAEHIYNRAVALEKQGRYREAMLFYREALRLSQDMDKAAIGFDRDLAWHRTHILNQMLELQ